jgi:outer membrane receptor for ferrienterochelin and colicin
MEKDTGLRPLIACLLLACCATLTAWGQGNITTGAMQGVTTDQSGGVVPAAVVEAKNLDTNVVKTATTDENGRFVLLALQPGRYSLSVRKQGYARLVQESLTLTVGQTINLSLALKVSNVEETVTITTAAPTVDTVKTEASSTLNETAVANTPVLGRKFSDLFTLTPGVSITQGPDGDVINFVGQRGVFNNISLDGGDYNNGFFGEQVGGQRAAIDITLDAIKEFQVVATGASAEFGRTAGGVVNVITKSGTNNFRGTVFHFQRLESLTSDPKDGNGGTVKNFLKDFHREQFGGTLGGPIVKDKVFFFGAYEQITGNLTRPGLSAPIGTPCSVQNPTIQANEALINSSADCQRLALLNFFRTTRQSDEGQPIKKPVNTSAFLGKLDWALNNANNLAFSYNFSRSKKENETFDVPTYGNSANGTEGPGKINVFNVNLYSTLSAEKLNEFHFTFSREDRPRSGNQSNVAADTAMGFATTFRFGTPFFLQPGIDELFQRLQFKDTFSWVAGQHQTKFGGEYIRSNNTQVFRGFFTGRYIFDSVTGFLRYASPASLGAGFGPNIKGCSNGTYVAASAACPTGSTATGGPLLLYLQGAGPNGPATDAAGASDINNDEFALFAQDKYQWRQGFTWQFGLRWEAQVFPNPTVDPSRTAYGIFLNDPRFPSDGTLPDQWKMFQPRVGFAWDVNQDSKSVLRASWGIYNARQNMLSQVGSITTNGVQQQTIFRNSELIALGLPAPTWPNVLTPTANTCSGPRGNNPFPCFSGIRAFSRDYANPRVYTTNVQFERQLATDTALYLDFTHSKGVHMTRFLNYGRLGFFAPYLDETAITSALGKSLYRGFTVGLRKRLSKGFQFDTNYVLAKDLDDDSNERDPFSDRSFDLRNLQLDYALSDRDIRHKFNFLIYGETPGGFQINTRVQARSAQPITPGARTATNRNSVRKNNEFFSFDWRVSRPVRFGERYSLIPTIEMFNTFNNKNLINPLVTPGLFNFDGFLRQGFGDPRQLQLAVKFTF